MPIRKIARSTGHASRGLANAYTTDKSFRWEVWGIIGYVIVAYLLWPLSLLEFLALLFSYTFILIAELLNTAIEKSLDKLHPARHNEIGIAKDVASAAVLVSLTSATIVVATLLLVQYGGL